MATDPITVSIRREVDPAHIAEATAWVQTGVNLANKYPGFLKAIADVLPLTYFTKLTRDVMVRHHHIWAEKSSLAVVFAWGVIGLVAAIRGFRWQPREA